MSVQQSAYQSTKGKMDISKLRKVYACRLGTGGNIVKICERIKTSLQIIRLYSLQSSPEQSGHFEYSHGRNKISTGGIENIFSPALIMWIKSFFCLNP